MPKGVGKRTVRFGLFEADLQSGELRRDGQKVRLQEQPYQLLVLLLEKRGEVVTREDLRAKLWPADTFVDFDHGLNAAVKRLRDALGDSAENPRFVETLARRGYRFIAPVEPASEASPDTSTTRRNWLIPLTFAVLLLVGVSIAWHAGHHSAAAVRPSEKRLTGNRENDPIWSAALSPDGKYLAFTYKTGLFLRVLPSGETHALTQVDSRRANGVSWFPDSTRMLVTRSEGPGYKPELWWESALGGEAHKIIDDGEQGAVSPVGTKIAFLRGEYNKQELWVMDADGEHAEKLAGAGGEFGSVTWSPDGRYLACLHHEGYIKGASEDVSVEIYEPMRKGIGDSYGESHVVLRNSRLWNALAWTRDNRLIYSLSEPPPNRTDSNLWAQKIDPITFQPAGVPVRLTSGPDGKFRLTLSADTKQLTYLRTTYSPHVYVAELNGTAGHVGALQQLSLDERGNYPYDWTADGKSLIFKSDRDGSFHLFKQALDERVPELLAGGDDNVLIARMDPKGLAVLYLLTAPPSDYLSKNMRIMRLPLSGGVPQLVLSGASISNFQCSRRLSDVCVLSMHGPDGGLTFYTFDSQSGMKTFLTTIRDQDWSMFNWSLSPDGTMLAVTKHRAGAPAEISILRLAGGERTIPVSGWFSTDCIDWAADGRSVWVKATSSSGTPTLLRVTLSGKITPVLQEDEMVLGWAIPSPEGRHIAIWKGEQSSNAWLLEGF
jgi:DNA-binding winged helix-turn-helix (wHTH) protein/Tol biopolymer transport system component